MDSFKQFFLYFLQYPFLLIGGVWKDIQREYIFFFLINQIGFILSGITGLIMIFREIVRKNNPVIKRQKLLFLLFITIIPAGVIFLPIYKQNYLMFLPAMSIVVSYLAFLIGTGLKNMSRKLLIQYLFMIILLLSLLYPAIGELFLYQQEKKLTIQKAVTHYVLKNTSRTDPLFITWPWTGGYMFNADLQYFWMASENTPESIFRITGHNAFGRNILTLLEEKNVSFILASKDDLYRVLPKDVIDYIFTHYTAYKTIPIFWRRVDID